MDNIKSTKLRKYFAALYLILIIVISVLFSLTHADRVKLSRTYYYYKDLKAILGDNVTGIPPTVTDYWKDKQHIIVRQHPKWPPEAIYGNVDYPFGYDVDYFWIIDKNDDSIRGPLDSIAYFKALKNINSQR